MKLRQGYVDEAAPISETGYKVSGKNPTWNWRFRILQARVLLAQHKPTQAFSLLDSEPSNISDLDILVRKRTVQGQALCWMNKTNQAGGLLSEAERLIPANERGLAAELAFVRADCAVVSDRSSALRYYTQAAELAKGRDLFTYATALLGVGYVLLSNEHYDEAIDVLDQARGATDYPAVRERALGNLGFCYSQLGDFRRAVDFSKQAATLAEELKRLDAQERWLLDLGREYDALPGVSPGAAESSYQKALFLATKLGDAEIARHCLHNLTKVALKNHDVTTAEEYWKKEVAAISRTSDGTMSSFDEARIAVAKADFPRAASGFQTLLAQSNIYPVLRAAIEQDLASVYWSQGKTSQADIMFRNGIQTAEQSLAGIREDHRASFLDQYPFYDTYVRFLASQGKTTRALQIAERGRRAADVSYVGAARNLDIEAMRVSLEKTKQVVLDYQLTNEESLLWIVTPTQFKVFRLPGHAELYSQIEAYNKEIQDHRDTTNSAAAQRLFTTLIQPAANLIPKNSSVTIIPSKVLYGLNFETLVVPGANPHYWIDDVEIQTASSLTAINTQPLVRQRPARDLLQVGAPVEASKEFPVLKYAGEEMGKITQRFAGRAQTIAGKDATPQAYLSSNPQDYRMIQFVTHGTASETVPLESAIILSEQPDRSYKLYARDIVKTPLRADLVTISACYGAGTRWYLSEGLVGLAWAFLHAGAHQVVAGLWEVDDAATPQLMDHFYEGLQQGKSAAAALRAAKLKMLHSDTVYKHPFYWASLQLYTGR